MQAARSASEQRVPDPLLLRQGVLPALAALLRAGHLSMLQAWPVRRGGGRAGACALLAAVADLLLGPLLPRARTSPEHMQLLHEVTACPCCLCAWSMQAGCIAAWEQRLLLCDRQRVLGPSCHQAGHADSIADWLVQVGMCSSMVAAMYLIAEAWHLRSCCRYGCQSAPLSLACRTLGQGKVNPEALHGDDGVLACSAWPRMAWQQLCPGRWQLCKETLPLLTPPASFWLSCCRRMPPTTTRLLASCCRPAACPLQSCLSKA